MAATIDDDIHGYSSLQSVGDRWIQLLLFCNMLQQDKGRVTCPQCHHSRSQLVFQIQDFYAPQELQVLVLFLLPPAHPTRYGYHHHHQSMAAILAIFIATQSAILADTRAIASTTELSYSNGCAASTPHY